MAILDANTLTRAQRLARDLRRQGRDDDAQTVDALLKTIDECGESSAAAQDTPRYLTTGEVGQRLGVSRQTVVNWIKRGLLPGVRLGGRLMVPAAVMDRFSRLERILDDMDAEREPGQPSEIVELVRRGREGWTWPGKE